MLLRQVGSRIMSVILLSALVGVSGLSGEEIKKEEYIGTVVNPTMPGYRILKSTMISVKSVRPASVGYYDISGEREIRESCRRSQGIGVVNYRENLVFGNAVTVWLFYGDCIMKAVPE